jgi:hypothetical protein
MADHQRKQYDHLSLAESWPAVFEHTGTAFSPMGIILADVAYKKSYRFNFEQQLKSFVMATQAANQRADDDIIPEIDIDRLVNLVVRAGIGGWAHPNLQFLSELAEVEQAAILYALICVEGTIFGGDGSIIRKRLMQGKNKEKNTGYLQTKTDEEYFNYMEHNYKKFCMIANQLKPKKSKQIETVAGYLILG